MALTMDVRGESEENWKEVGVVMVRVIPEFKDSMSSPL